MSSDEHEFEELAGTALAWHLRAWPAGHGVDLAREDLRGAQHRQLHFPPNGQPVVGAGMTVPTDEPHEHGHGPAVPSSAFADLMATEAAVDQLRALLSHAGLRIELDPAASVPPPERQCPHCGGRLWIAVETAQVEELHRLRRVASEAFHSFAWQAGELLRRTVPLDPDNPRGEAD